MLTLCYGPIAQCRKMKADESDALLASNYAQLLDCGVAKACVVPSAAQYFASFYVQLECGPIPKVMAAQPNIGVALCQSSVILFLVP